MLWSEIKVNVCVADGSAVVLALFEGMPKVFSEPLPFKGRESVGETYFRSLLISEFFLWGKILLFRMGILKSIKLACERAVSASHRLLVRGGKIA